jgi:hypothetical protein
MPPGRFRDGNSRDASRITPGIENDEGGNEGKKKINFLTDSSFSRVLANKGI